MSKKLNNPSVQQLMDMGFAESVAQTALDATAGDLEQATHLLLESPHLEPPSPIRAPTSSLSEHATESQRGLHERKGKSLAGLFSRSSKKLSNTHPSTPAHTPTPTATPALTPVPTPDLTTHNPLTSSSTNVQERKGNLLTVTPFTSC